MTTFTSVFVTLPDDLDQQIEASLDYLRSQLVDPSDPKDPGQMVRLALGVYSDLLAKLNPPAMQLAEPGILLQSAALASVIYFSSQVTPGEWVHESSEDFKRAYVAILMLLMLGDAQDAIRRSEAEAAPAPAEAAPAEAEAAPAEAAPAEAAPAEAAPAEAAPAPAEAAPAPAEAAPAPVDLGAEGVPPDSDPNAAH